jgi:predicted RNA-binding Zn ribbon-like protein
METPEYISALRVVGGDLALDFVNTLDGAPDAEPGFDCLQSYADLVHWGRHVGLLSEGTVRDLLHLAHEKPSEAEAAHERALGLRTDLYALFRAIALGEEASPESLEALKRAEREALSHASLVPEGGRFAWEWRQGEELKGVLWPVAHAATGLLTSGPLDRLKRCAGCRWLFLDGSRNKSRRWCTMEDCGTHEKMRRYVARRAARRKDE